MGNKYELLRQRKIIDILQGDVDFGFLKIGSIQRDIKIAMPYLKGSEICELLTRYGLPTRYCGSMGKSRWQYFDALLERCIANNSTSDLLLELFSQERFDDIIKESDLEMSQYVYNTIIHKIINEINKKLRCGKNELVFTQNRVVIQKIGDSPIIKFNNIKTVNRQYIGDISERALKDISEGGYDSAITKARTLLEEVFHFVIEKKGEKASNKGDIGCLYRQVKQLYNMHQDDNVDRRVNMLLSGLEKIVSSIAEMRNKNSDAHGLGSNRINVCAHHAKLAVNSAVTMAEFILEVSDRNITK